MAVILAGQDPTMMGYRQVVMPPVGASAGAPTALPPGYRGNPALADAPNVFRDAVSAWNTHLNRAADPATTMPLFPQQGALQMSGIGAPTAPASAAPASAAPFGIPDPFAANAMPDGMGAIRMGGKTVFVGAPTGAGGVSRVPDYQKAISNGYDQQAAYAQAQREANYEMTKRLMAAAPGQAGGIAIAAAHGMPGLSGVNSYASIQEQGATQLAQQQMERDREAQKIGLEQEKLYAMPRIVGDYANPDPSTRAFAPILHQYAQPIDSKHPGMVQGYAPINAAGLNVESAAKPKPLPSQEADLRAQMALGGKMAAEARASFAATFGDAAVKRVTGG